jgi:hypothetical protein
MPYLPFEIEMHTLLVGVPCILQPEHHFYIAKTTEGCDECGGRLVHLGNGYLVVARVGIQKTYELTPHSKVYNLVNSGERERILHACLVQACVIYTHSPLLILFRHKGWVHYLVWVMILLNKASGQELGLLFAHGPTLFLVKVLQVLIDRP